MQYHSLMIAMEAGACRPITGRGLRLLGERAREHHQFARADELLRGSVEAAESAGEATVVVDALEALAAVLSAEHRPREAAVLVGAADTQRGSASSSRRPPQPPDENLRRSLVRGAGALRVQRGPH
jgi:hypothetical protein